MPVITITRNWKIEGVLTNATQVVLSDPDGAFGIKRNDTDAVVVADGTAVENPSTGVYTYEFAAISGVAYTAYFEVLYGGAYYHLETDIPTVFSGSADELRKIVGAPTNVDLTPFLEAAEIIVDHCTEDSDYSDTKIAVIKKWVAAHLYASTDIGQESRMTSETLADWSGAFSFQVGKGLQSTIYGQQAMLLDTEGCLTRLSQSQSNGSIAPSLDWLGKSPLSVY